VIRVVESFLLGGDRRRPHGKVLVSDHEPVHDPGFRLASRRTGRGSAIRVPQNAVHKREIVPLRQVAFGDGQEKNRVCASLRLPSQKSLVPWT